MKDKIKKIKEALGEAEAIADEVCENAYKVVISYDSADKQYLLEVFDKDEKKIYEKEISEEEAEKLEDELYYATIEKDIADKIEELFEKLKEEKIIEDYEIKFDCYEKKIGMHDTYIDCDVDVAIYLDEETAEEVAEDEELRDYLEDNEIYITICNVTVEHKTEVYYLVNKNTHVATTHSYYTTYKPF